jgi:hypothetical protein
MSQAIGEEAIAAYRRGTAEPGRLQRELGAVWTEAKDDPVLRAEMAAILGVPPEALDGIGDPPMAVEAPRSGATGGEVVVIVLTWWATEVLLGAAKELMKDAVKTKVRALWDQVLLPRLSRRLPDRFAIGAEQPAEKT